MFHLPLRLALIGFEMSFLEAINGRGSSIPHSICLREVTVLFLPKYELLSILNAM